MKAIANFVIAMSDFVRVEARELRRHVVATAMMLALTVGAAVLVLCGVVILLLGFYTGLLSVTPPSAALAITGLIAILAGGGCLWLIAHQAK